MFHCPRRWSDDVRAGPRARCADPGQPAHPRAGLSSAPGEFPVAALAEEIDTPDPESGERVRALITVAGNPVVSTPDAARLERALGSLDLLVCLDATH